jgi:hypothetical protein
MNVIRRMILYFLTKLLRAAASTSMSSFDFGFFELVDVADDSA